MTPREVLLQVEAAAWQAEQEQRRMLSMAWHMAALQRAKRLPSLKQLLRPPSKASQLPLSERRKEFAALKERVASWKEEGGSRPAPTEGR